MSSPQQQDPPPMVCQPEDEPPTSPTAPIATATLVPATSVAAEAAVTTAEESRVEVEAEANAGATVGQEAMAETQKDTEAQETSGEPRTEEDTNGKGVETQGECLGQQETVQAEVTEEDGEGGGEEPQDAGEDGEGGDEEPQDEGEEGANAKGKTEKHAGEKGTDKTEQETAQGVKGTSEEAQAEKNGVREATGQQEFTSLRSLLAQGQSEGPSLHEQAQRRRRALCELGTLEKDFANTLQRLDTCYIRPIAALAASQELPGALCTSLLSNLPSLLTLHQGLDPALTHFASLSPSSKSIEPIGEEEADSEEREMEASPGTLFAGQPWSAYSSYINGVESMVGSLAAVACLESPSEAVRTWLVGLDTVLESLAQPLQHVVKYVPLLQQLRECTPSETQEDQAERARLEQAIDELSNVTSLAIQRKASVQATVAVLRVQVLVVVNTPRDRLVVLSPPVQTLASATSSTPPFMLLVPHRRLLREDPGLVEDVARARHKCVVFMFNDLLLWTSPEHCYLGHCLLSTAKLQTGSLLDDPTLAQQATEYRVSLVAAGEEEPESLDPVAEPITPDDNSEGDKTSAVFFDLTIDHGQQAVLGEGHSDRVAGDDEANASAEDKAWSSKEKQRLRVLTFQGGKGGEHWQQLLVRTAATQEGKPEVVFFPCCRVVSVVFDKDPASTSDNPGQHNLYTFHVSLLPLEPASAFPPRRASTDNSRKRSSVTSAPSTMSKVDSQDRLAPSSSPSKTFSSKTLSKWWNKLSDTVAPAKAQENASSNAVSEVVEAPSDSTGPRGSQPAPLPQTEEGNRTRSPGMLDKVQQRFDKFDVFGKKGSATGPQRFLDKAVADLWLLSGATIQRRFSHFNWLDSELRKVLGVQAAKEMPPFPPKYMYGNVEQRKNQLTAYMNRLLMNPRFRTSLELRVFLSPLLPMVLKSKNRLQWVLGLGDHLTKTLLNTKRGTALIVAHRLAPEPINWLRPLVRKNVMLVLHQTLQTHTAELGPLLPASITTKWHQARCTLLGAQEARDSASQARSAKRKERMQQQVHFTQVAQSRVEKQSGAHLAWLPLTAAHEQWRQTSKQRREEDETAWRAESEQGRAALLQVAQTKVKEVVSVRHRVVGIVQQLGDGQIGPVLEKVSLLRCSPPLCAALHRHVAAIRAETKVVSAKLEDETAQFDQLAATLHRGAAVLGEEEKSMREDNALVLTEQAAIDKEAALRRGKEASIVQVMDSAEAALDARLTRAPERQAMTQARNEAQKIRKQAQEERGRCVTRRRALQRKRRGAAEARAQKLRLESAEQAGTTTLLTWDRDRETSAELLTRRTAEAEAVLEEARALDEEQNKSTLEMALVLDELQMLQQTEADCTSDQQACQAQLVVPLSPAAEHEDDVEGETQDVFMEQATARKLALWNRLEEELRLRNEEALQLQKEREALEGEQAWLTREQRAMGDEQDSFLQEQQRLEEENNTERKEQEAGNQKRDTIGAHVQEQVDAQLRRQQAIEQRDQRSHDREEARLERVRAETERQSAWTLATEERKKIAARVVERAAKMDTAPTLELLEDLMRESELDASAVAADLHQLAAEEVAWNLAREAAVKERAEQQKDNRQVNADYVQLRQEQLQPLTAHELDNDGRSVLPALDTSQPESDVSPPTTSPTATVLPDPVDWPRQLNSLKCTTGHVFMAALARTRSMLALNRAEQAVALTEQQKKVQTAEEATEQDADDTEEKVGTELGLQRAELEKLKHALKAEHIAADAAVTSMKPLLQNVPTLIVESTEHSIASQTMAASEVDAPESALSNPPEECPGAEAESISSI